jgi:hypothetical protein
MSGPTQAKASIDTAGAGQPAADTAASADTQQQQEKPRQQPAAPPGADLRQRLDQVGSILAKGLDLAEAGISLGVTIISRVGVAAQHKFREGMDAATAHSAASAGAAPAPAQHAAAEQQAEPIYGITNRLPLKPGSEVNISFSVNNDSTTEPKKVDLRIEGFVGDAHGARLDASTFTVEPVQVTIAPVDFEKLRLQGRVPAEAPPDVYRGAIVVLSGNQLKIPVVLVVMQH